MELSRHNDAEPLTLDAARALYQYEDFTGFLLAFKAITERLRTPEDYELITYRMIEALARQGVVHAEVYVSVGVVYYWRRIEFEPLFEGMERGRMRGEREFGVSVLLDLRCRASLWPGRSRARISKSRGTEAAAPFHRRHRHRRRRAPHRAPNHFENSMPRRKRMACI